MPTTIDRWDGAAAACFGAASCHNPSDDGAAACLGAASCSNLYTMGHAVWGMWLLLKEKQRFTTLVVYEAAAGIKPETPVNIRFL